MSETVALADTNCAAMDAGKLWAFYGVAGAIFWTYEDSFNQFQARTLDLTTWESDATILKRLMGHPAYRVAWKMARDGMRGPYRDYVDTLMQGTKNDTSQTFAGLFEAYVTQELRPA